MRPSDPRTPRPYAAAAAAAVAVAFYEGASIKSTILPRDSSLALAIFVSGPSSSLGAMNRKANITKLNHEDEHAAHTGRHTHLAIDRTDKLRQTSRKRKEKNKIQSNNHEDENDDLNLPADRRASQPASQPASRQAEGSTDSRMDEPMDGRTDRRTDTQTDRQTDETPQIEGGSR